LISLRLELNIKSLLHKKLADPLYKRYLVTEKILLLQVLVCYWFQTFFTPCLCDGAFHHFPHGTFILYTLLEDYFGFYEKGFPFF